VTSQAHKADNTGRKAGSSAASQLRCATKAWNIKTTTNSPAPNNHIKGTGV
jgi:hypothetical protein